MIMRAVAQEDTRELGFRLVPLEVLLQSNRIEFPYEFPAGTTYRQAIQTYLDYQPWSDLGIDLALGTPCDDVSGPYGLMFLPDSLMVELEHATVDGQLLCAEPSQILMPRMNALPGGLSFSPMILFGLLFILQLILLAKNKSGGPNWLDATLVTIAGLVGLLVVFLWFFTDHAATVWNWNILWANPLHLFFVFLAKRNLRLAKYYSVASLALLIASIAFYPIIPQSFNPAVFVIMGMLIIAFARYYRRANFTQSKPSTL
jgi:hypothetical protein